MYIYLGMTFAIGGAEQDLLRSAEEEILMFVPR